MAPVCLSLGRFFFGVLSFGFGSAPLGLYRPLAIVFGAFGGRSAFLLYAASRFFGFGLGPAFCLDPLRLGTSGPLIGLLLLSLGTLSRFALSLGGRCSGLSFALRPGLDFLGFAASLFRNGHCFCFRAGFGLFAGAFGCFGAQPLLTLPLLARNFLLALSLCFGLGGLARYSLLQSLAQLLQHCRPSFGGAVAELLPVAIVTKLSDARDQLGDGR